MRIVSRSHGHVSSHRVSEPSMNADWIFTIVWSTLFSLAAFVLLLPSTTGIYPLTLQDRGGWLNRDTAYAFAEYAEVVAHRLGDRVDWWLTHNEPWCSAYLGYADGIYAPGLHDKNLAVIAGHHVLL